MPTAYEVQVTCDARQPAASGPAASGPAASGPAGSGPAGDDAARPGSRPWAGPAMMFGGALSNQLGAATGALAFGAIGPAGVVAVRQWIAGIVLLAAEHPKWRSFS